MRVRARVKGSGLGQCSALVHPESVRVRVTVRVRVRVRVIGLE